MAVLVAGHIEYDEKPAEFYPEEDEEDQQE